MFICRYCGSNRKNLRSLSQHEVKCSKNENRIVSNQYIKAKMCGLEIPSMSESTKQKLRNFNVGRKWSVERKERHSKIMLDVVKNNPDSYSKSNVSGRVKLLKYNNTTLKGGWELLVAKWLDVNNVEWLNDISPIPYTFNGKSRLYFPDFYLPKYETYIEVKGYKRDIDVAKWSSVHKDLVIIDKNTIYKLDDIDDVAHFIQTNKFSY